jgi:hypothetical protein
MNSSCISHPASDPLVLIRSWQVEFCQGNTTAAALMSLLEYWHNIKLAMAAKAIAANDIAEQGGDDRQQDETLLQFHTEENLVEGLLGLAKRDSIRKAVRWLEAKGVVTIHRNPNPKYSFDRTKYFRFRPEILNAWIQGDYRKSTLGREEKSKNRQSSVEKSATRDGCNPDGYAMPKNRRRGKEERGKSIDRQSIVDRSTFCDDDRGRNGEKVDRSTLGLDENAQNPRHASMSIEHGSSLMPKNRQSSAEKSATEAEKTTTVAEKSGNKNRDLLLDYSRDLIPPLPPKGKEGRGSQFGFQVEEQEKSIGLLVSNRELQEKHSAALTIKSTELHPALIYDPEHPEDTPWLEPPTRREVRVGSPRFHKAFLEWGGALYAQKFAKTNKFEAMGDFRISLQQAPDKILSRWEEYESVMGAAFQNVIDRQSAGVTIDERDRQKFDTHRRALEGQHFDVPQPRPVLEEVAQTAQEHRSEAVDWDAIAERDAQFEKEYLLDLEDSTVVDIQCPSAGSDSPVRESTEDSPPPASSDEILASQREFMARMSQLTQSMRLKAASQAPRDTRTLIEKAIETSDRILLNDPSVKHQLQQRAATDLLELIWEGDEIVQVIEPDF